MRVIIDNIVIDLGDKVGINLNRIVTDLENIDSASGDWSYTIEFPKSKNNNIAFQNANTVETIDKFVRQIDYGMTVETYGANQINGLFKLTDITTTSYKGVFYGNNIAWAKLLDGVNLNELKNFDGSIWGFDFIGASGSSVQNSFAWHVNNDNYDTSDVTFPLIPRGNFFHSVNAPISQFYDDSLTFSEIPAAPFELKIVKQIFSSIGWSVDGSPFGDVEAKKVVLPFVSGDFYKWNFKLLYEARSQSSSSVAVDYPHNIYDYYTATETLSDGRKTAIYWFNPNNETYDPLDRINPFSFHVFNDSGLPIRTGQTYHIPATGPIDIDLHLKFTEGLGITSTSEVVPDNWNINPLFNNGMRGGFFLYQFINGTYEQDVFKNVSDYILSPSAGAIVTHPLVVFYYDCFLSTQNVPVSFQPYNPTADISVTNTIGFDSFTVGIFAAGTLITGGTVDVQIRGLDVGATENLRWAWISYADNPNPNGTAASKLALDEVSWSFGAPSGYTSNQVDIASNLPEMSCLDFLRNWISKSKLFMSFAPDNKTVRFDTFDSFYLPNDLAIDLTEKVDYNYGEPEILPIEISKVINFKYSNDNGDALISQDMEYGNLEVASDNIYTQGTQVIQLNYSSTKTRDYTYFNSYYNSGVTVNLPMIATQNDVDNSDLTTIDWKFNSTPRILKTDGYFTDLTGGTVLASIDGYDTKIILSRFEDNRDGYLSLRWDELNQGMYDRYYERYLNQIEDSHILKLNSRISALDFNNMQPQYPIKIKNQHYFLNKIENFDVSENNTSLTNIELIKKFTN